jgi:formylglycine-generating enzyme required for sulfatase activity
MKIGSLFFSALLYLTNVQAEDCVYSHSDVGTLFSDAQEQADIQPVGVMVRVIGGKYCMGDIAGNGEADEKPVHLEQVSDFWLARYEVTRGQFRKFVVSTGYVSDAERVDSAEAGCLAVDPEEWTFKYREEYFWDAPGFKQADTHPVVCISYEDALAFISWAKQETGLPFRLPTEAEWEYVARAGTQSTYSWGELASGSCDSANVADQSAWPGYSKSPFGRIVCNDGYSFTAPVGQYEANPHGVFDISGNVWEWTSDCWAKNYLLDKGPEFCGPRVFRGSSWMNSEKSLRSSNRSKNGPTDRLNTVGFRMALDDIRVSADEYDAQIP